MKSSKELYDIFKAKKWIDEEVDLINPDNSNKKDSFDVYEENTKLKQEIEELKKQLAQSKEQPKPTKKVIVSEKEITSSISHIT